jgi:hypothetical protein
MMNVPEIRDLAKKFSPDQIEECITQQIETGENVCLRDYSTQVVVGELAKAEFIKKLMGEGMSLADALRELARRMRLLHEQSGEEK